MCVYYLFKEEEDDGIIILVLLLLYYLKSKMNTTTGVVVGYYLFIIGESKTIIITFDGIGGTLAEATSSFIRFDSAERWTLGEVHRAG